MYHEKQSSSHWVGDFANKKNAKKFLGFVVWICNKLLMGCNYQFDNPQIYAWPRKKTIFRGYVGDVLAMPRPQGGIAKYLRIPALNYGL